MAVLVAAIAALAILWLAVLRARRPRRGTELQDLFAEGFPGAVLVFDRRLRHSSALGRGVEAMGIDPLGASLHEVFPADVCLVLEPTYRAVFDGVESQVEVPLGGRDWLITVSPLGRTAGLLVATDVTERKRRERRLTELASRDVLTGRLERTTPHPGARLAAAERRRRVALGARPRRLQAGERHTGSRRRATSCCGGSRRPCRDASAGPTSSRGSAATSSRCSSRVRRPQRRNR